MRGLHERLRDQADGQGPALLARVPRKVRRQMAEGKTRIEIIIKMFLKIAAPPGFLFPSVDQTYLLT